jgi:KDO2-lipid IV(A) lauroyltransferase
MRQGRKRFGGTHLLSSREGLRPLVKRLRNRRPIVYSPDQDFGQKNSIFVPFFGISTATVTTLHRLTSLASAKVLPVTMQRNGHRFELTIYPVWENFPTSDVVCDTQRMNQWFEACIRQYPEDYFWTHRRFKTRPADEEPYY